MWARLLAWARRLRRDILTLWFAGRDPTTPLVAKLLALALAAYAFSPIDLIPDFIPVIGFLDEMVLLPLGIALCVQLIPAPVLAVCRERADRWLAERKSKPRSWIGAAVIVVIWLLAAWGIWRLVAD
ncbi:MAG: DUF1232 domain-containing protein [Burkholderiales bacterium]|nr:DUF1232 domain-containing protein [Burkholderiales bacterium]